MNEQEEKLYCLAGDIARILAAHRLLAEAKGMQDSVASQLTLCIMMLDSCLETLYSQLPGREP